MPATPTPVQPAGNLVKNGAFSTPKGAFPADWQERPSGSWDSSVGRASPGSLRVSGSANTYSFQNVTLRPGARYALSYWVKTQGVVGRGVSMRYPQTMPTTQILTALPYTTGTQNWSLVSTTFTVPAAYVGGRLDILWELSSGTAWVDDVTLTEVP